MDPAPCKITINGHSRATYAADTSFRLDFKAGLGRHYVKAVVGEREYDSWLSVYRCGKESMEAADLS